MNKLKVCAVIVTYGNRFNLLEKVINSTLKEGVDKIIIIDNASEIKSRKKLKHLENKLKEKLKVIYLNENKGSAGGYKKGLEIAYKCDECEFIWLLDDDNEPQKDSLKILKEFWNKLNEKNKEFNTALLSYRSDRVIYKEAIMKNKPDLVLGRKNSFLGFNIIDLPKKIIRVIKRKMGIPIFKENPIIKSREVSVAPYGGIFFHKNLIKTIGYPREEFFVYADDHEWSYRIIKNGGKIYLILESCLEDIDKSWHFKEREQTIFYKILNLGSYSRVYYSIRNRIYFEITERVSNKFIYKINYFIFIFILNFFKNKKNLKRYKIFKLAVQDGLAKKLGKNENFNF